SSALRADGCRTCQDPGGSPAPAGTCIGNTGRRGWREVGGVLSVSATVASCPARERGMPMAVTKAMAGEAREFPFSDRNFEQLRQIAFEHTGIVLGENKRQMMYG